MKNARCTSVIALAVKLEGSTTSSSRYRETDRSFSQKWLGGGGD